MKVIIRSNMSGVWFADLVEKHPAGALWTVKLANARRCFYWEGCATCSGLAMTGPTAGKILAPVKSVDVGDVCEIIECSPEAATAFDKIAPWDGKN